MLARQRALKLGYFDIQVNGYGGIDFNQDDLSPEGLHTACEHLRADGVDGILATIITEELQQMAERLRRLVRLRCDDPLARDVIVGVHIEGPFLSDKQGYRGAHPLDPLQPASVDAMKLLLDATDGLLRLVTLAPEQDQTCKVIRYLADQDIVVSAGHCDPSLDQLRAAIDAGLSMFTHLGNGCPMHLHRHDNVIQRTLSLAQSNPIWLCFIADGVHVDMPALGNYLRLAGMDRAIVVTDAVAPAGLGPGRYTVGRWDLQIGEDLVSRSPDGSHWVGSAKSMSQCVENLRDHLGLNQEEIDLLVSTNPRRAVGCS